MSPNRHTLLTVVLTAAVLVGGANLAAYAANGKPLLLGKSNVETKSMKLKNKGNGPAVKLKSKSGSPALAVSNTQKITKLNADLVDGLDGTALTTDTTVYRSDDHTTVFVGQQVWPFTVGPGTYELSFNVGISPSGPGVVLCGFLLGDETGFGWQSDTFGTSYNGVWLSASSTQSFPTATPVSLYCNAEDGSFKLEDEVPLQIEVTKINSATVQNAPTPVPFRPGAPAGR